MLLSEPDDLLDYAINIPKTVWPLVERFWPGPLTLVLRRASTISDMITGGRDTVALRVPDHPLPRAIVRQLGGPITGTSANLSGGREATTAAEVRRTLGSLVDMVVDSPEPTSGHASTVLDISTGRLRVLRQGAVSRREIEETCGELVAV